MSNDTPQKLDLNKVLMVEQIPAMPHSALTILRIDNDLAKVNIMDMVRPIEADPGLASQVLKFLNSSYFSFRSSISNVKQGIALVGIRIVKNFVLWKVIFSLIPKSRVGNFDVGFLWQDSLRRAMFARFMLMESRRGDSEIAFAGALLQDMAVPLLLTQIPSEYGRVLEKLFTQPLARLSEIEQEIFGWNHAEAAAKLGNNWQLPPILISITENHLKIDGLVDQFTQQPEQAIVALSALLPSAAKPEWFEKELFINYFEAMFPGKPTLISSIFSKVDKEFEQYASFMEVIKPKKTMMEYLIND